MDMLERLGSALGARYRVDRELGRGGMAVVYLAHDEKHGRPVAVKVLRPELAAAMGAERFLREIEIAARLNHPNILGLHDSGEADGLLYFVMPFVEGHSLRDRIEDQGQMTVEDATRVVREVGSALDYAHEQGLVHRDIKPENILFQAGHALVCDFGIAKAASEAQERLTQTGLAIGTFAYMSPEQASGDAVVDGRADLYALGCMFHEMLAGENPFAASTAQAVLAKKLMGTIPALSSTRPDVPSTVDEVMGNVLATDPADRFTTSEEFVVALDTAMSEESVARVARLRRRGRLLRSAAMVAGITALGLGGRWLAAVLGAPTMESLVVLPFSNGRGESDQDFFVQGLYQDLTLELGRAGIRVKSASSAARYAESDLPDQRIAAELGVDGVVRVSGALISDSVDVELVLVDGETGDLLWVASFAGSQRNILPLLGEMTRAIASEIEVQLSEAAEARLAAAPPVDPAVYEALLHARFNWQKLTEEGLDAAFAYYELALLRSDSLSAEAWNGLGAIWTFRAQNGLISSEEASRRAGPALARAAELDPELSSVQASLALRKTWAEWEWRAAEEAFVNALGTDPFDATTRAYYALLLLYLGRKEDAEVQASRAAEDDPISATVQGLYAQYLNSRREYGAAEEVLQQALRRDQDVPFLLSTLRTTYHLMGREEDALANWRASFTSEGAYSAEGDEEALQALDRGYEEGGYRGALRAVAELLVVRSESESEYVSQWAIATLYTRAGMKDEALHYFELSCIESRNLNCPYLSVEPTFDFLRDEPRFRAIIDELGLPR